MSEGNMNVVIVPGYRDRVDYIERLAGHWEEGHGLAPHVHAFGTTNPAETYDQHWEKFTKTVEELGQAAIIGISFGAGIAARALQEYPEQVNRIVNICGPWRLADINPETVDTKYPMFNKSLAAFDVGDLPHERIMTVRPLTDSVVSPKKVYLEGATNLRVPVVGHVLGIVAALSWRAKTMANFLRQ